MVKYKVLTTLEDVRKSIEVVSTVRDYYVLDIETVSKTSESKDATNPHKALPVDIQLLGETDEEIIIFSAKFAECLTGLDVYKPIVGQNLKYDLICLAKNCVDLTDYWWYDTMILDHLIDERFSHSLDNIVDRYFGKVDYKSDFWAKYASYLEAPEYERYQYGANDIYWTNRVFIKQKNVLKL